MKLAEALSLIQKAPPDAPPYPLLLACGFSPLHLQTFLRAHLQSRLRHRRVEIVTGLYGSLAETLERLPSFQVEAAALFLEWPDLDPRLGYRTASGWNHQTLPDILINVQATLARLSTALRNKPAPLRVVISLPTLPLPPAFHTTAIQASTPQLALEKAVVDFAHDISLLPALTVLHRAALNSTNYDFRSDLRTGFPYSLPHADALAESAARLLSPAPPKKGLITDLDDTLWRGIVGEDGVSNVAWALPNHAQVHGLYQQMLQSLASQGVLLAIASKNNATIAEEALGRPDMVVKREKFFPAEIHWDAKSTSVQRILNTWNVSADSVVFIDDSPMELEEVRAAHPGIECILFPKNDHAQAFTLLHHLRDLYGKQTLSLEDSFRLDSIRNSQLLLANTADEFLSSAQAVVTFQLNPPPGDSRLLELIQKTNQFNLNGKRHLNAAPGTFTLAVSYQDKFGPLGKIAVLAAQQDYDTLLIQTWVMSCRAFSRRIEHQILHQLFEKTGATQIQFDYLSTPKNGPFTDFLSSILGADLPPSPRITQKAFQAHCPTLYHRIDFTGQHKDSSWTTQKHV